MIRAIILISFFLYPILSPGQTKDTTLAFEYKKQALQFEENIQYDSALVYYRKATEIYRAKKQWFQYYYTRLREGRQLVYLGKPEQAKTRAAETRAILKRKKINKKVLLMAHCWNITAVANHRRGYRKESMKACLKAEQMFTKAGKPLKALRVKLVRISVLYRLGLYAQVLATIKEAKKELKQSPQSPALTRLKIGVYLLQCSVQVGYLRAYDKALKSCYQGLALSKNLKLTKQDLENKSSFYFNQATIFKAKGELSKAKQKFRQNIRLTTQVKGEKHITTIEGILQLGRVYIKEQKLDSALYYIKKSAALYLLKYSEDDPKLAYVYNNLGYIYTLKKDYKQANQNYAKALTSLKKVYGSIHPNLVLLYIYMGANYNYMGQYKKALKTAHQALMSNTRTFRDTNVYAIPPFKDYYNINFFLGNIIGKGNALTYASGTIEELKIALKHYKTADRYIKQLRKGVKDKNDRLLVGRILNSIPVYGIKTCELLYQKTRDRKYLEEAFYFAERNKASLLISSLAEAKAKKFGNIPASLLKEELLLRKKHAFYQKQLKFNKGTSYQDSLYMVDHAYEELIKKFEQRYPKYAQLKFEQKRVTLQDIQQTLSPETALLEYTFCRYNVYLMVITRKQVKLIRIPDVEKVKQFLSNYYNQLDAQARLKKFAKASYQLYQAILQPAQTYLTKVKKLVVIAPDTENIPFEALVTQPTLGKNLGDNFARPSYLVKKYQISYHYSASLWQKNIQNRVPTPPQLTAFAPFSTGEAKVYHTRSQPGKLPESGVEVKAIYNLFQARGFTAEAYLSKTATKNAFLQRATQASFVHIASHSKANADNAGLARISFAANNNKRKNLSENLLSNEIYNLELNAELLVLSSCESGIGKFAEGEGVLSLVRSFLYAGARNILFSLWEIDDLYTRQLMVAFYKHLLNQPKFDYQRSLQAAQLSMIQQGIHPKHWAGIIMIGK